MPDTPPASSHRRFVVGLTGGIGSGKSFVADRFALHGATLVDADAIAHELTGPAGAAMPAIIDEFGADIAAADGRLDRAAMRDRVFRDPDARRRLERILHPMIRDVSEQRIAQAPGPYAMSVVPLLVEGGNPRGRVDRVLVVDCPEEEQVARVIRRNGLPREQVLAIMASQASRAQRLAAADDVIDNGAPGGSPLSTLDARIEALHREYEALAHAKARHPGA